MVLLTNNNTRELSEALKRRCLDLHIDCPTAGVEMSIVRLKVPDMSEELAQQAAAVVQQLRNMDLRKVPCPAPGLAKSRAPATVGYR